MSGNVKFKNTLVMIVEQGMLDSVYFGELSEEDKYPFAE